MEEFEESESDEYDPMCVLLLSEFYEEQPPCSLFALKLFLSSLSLSLIRVYSYHSQHMH